MKRLILFVVLVLGLVSCFACAKKVPVPVIVDDATAPIDASVLDVETLKPANTPFIFENMEVVLPETNWALRQLSPAIVIAVGDNNKPVVFMGKESTTYNIEGYTLFSIREIRDAGGVLLSAKQIELNTTKFTLVEANKGSSTVLSWLTVKDGIGYSLSCSSLIVNKPQDICNQIASTLKIK